MYKFCISIPVHEKFDVILDQINNINYFLKGAMIILHLSKSFEIKDEEIKILESFGNVYINSERVSTKWGHILHAHISNWNFVKKFEYEYFIFHSSNDMFIKSGLEEEIVKYDYYFPLGKFNENWIGYNKVFKDESFMNLLKKLDIKNEEIYQCLTEGNYFRKDIINKVFEILEELKIDENSIYPREEIWTPTISNYVIKKYFSHMKKGKNYMFTEIALPRKKVLKTLTFMERIKYYLKKNIVRVTRENKKERIRLEVIYPSIIEKLIKNPEELEHLTSETYPIQNCFGIKRVDREINSNLRKYLRESNNFYKRGY
ncbi:MAG: hypothetical protein ACRCZO_00865 [Cetobacterium sp.]